MKRQARSQQQAAQALVWLALLMPLLLGVGGLAIDGAVVFTARRELQSVADGAARAGATRVDLGSLRANDGSAMRLVQGSGPDSAATAANDYLRERARHDLQWQNGLDWNVAVDGPSVAVSVRAVVPTAFMRIVSLNTVPLDATAAADVRHGIRAPGQ
jgi:Flp pilus assembly protein TadG